MLDAGPDLAALVVVSRAIGTLRQPDAARRALEEPAVALHARAELAANGAVGAQQRQIAVRGRAGRDLDVAFVLKLFECAQQVPVVAPVERILDVLVIALVETGQEFQMLVTYPPGLFLRQRGFFRQVSRFQGGAHRRAVYGRQFAFLGFLARDARRLFFAAKAQHVLLGARNLVREILVEVIEHVRIGQLLGQHRRDSHRDLVPYAFITQLVQRIQERNVGFAGRLVNPLLAVRPPPRQPGVRQMTVQDKRKRAKCTHC